MMNHPRLIHRTLGVALFALMVGAGFLACEADVESRCYDGPCSEQDDPLTTTSTETGSTTTTLCEAPKNGADACSDDPQDGDFPCEVFDVLKAKCQTCHLDPHAAGAPIDLLTCGRFHEQDCGPVRTRFRTAEYYVCTHFMPQGAKQLTDAESQTLQTWFDACAPCVPAGTGCSGPASPKGCYED